MTPPQPLDLVRQLAAAVRAADLYAPEHPLRRNAVSVFVDGCRAWLAGRPAVVIGCLGDDVVVDDRRLGKGSASLIGFVRSLRDREVEKITLHAGVTAEDVQTLIAELTRRGAAGTVGERLERLGIRRVTVGRVSPPDAEESSAGIEAARRIYGTAVTSAESLWQQAKAGDQPDPGTARQIIDSLSNIVNQDRTSLMALTALKKYDNYTFTHMVNVAALSMAQARSLGIDGPLLREFGFAALMHDIGKVQTPLEILNKPGKLEGGGVPHHEAARRGRRPRPPPHTGDAGAGADCRLRAPPQAGPLRLSGEHRPP